MVSETDGTDPLDCALDLMRRLPPCNVVENLKRVTRLAPDLTDEVLAAIDQPLRSIQCSTTGKDFLICDYNRDGSSYRSPHSNTYVPPLPDGAIPSAALRTLEETANMAFATYRDLYYEGGMSSVYMWDLEKGFACVVLIQKRSEMGKSSGGWDSIHVFEVLEREKKISHYKLTSTIMLYLDGAADSADLNITGSISRQTKSDHAVENQAMHLQNLGVMVETMESRLRDNITSVYFDRTCEFGLKLRNSRDSEDTTGALKNTNDVLSRIAASGRKLP